MQSDIVVQTADLSRSYVTYRKAEGVRSSIRGLFRRNYLTTVALEPLSLELTGGMIIGLVGANGAGKTTLLKLLSGLIYPSTGDARVLGFQPWKRERGFLRQISLLLGQKNQLWWDIPAADSFDLLGRIYDLRESVARDRSRSLARFLGCEHLLQIQLRRLSLGERMKMELIGSLLHSPRILFLDEPTLGLDIVAQAAIRSFLVEYVKQEGPTVLLTSHYMDDIARLAERLLILSRGKLVYDGTVREFTARARLKQRLTLALEESLQERVEVTPEVVFERGEQIFSVELHAEEVPQAIAKLTASSRATEIRLEEVNFEDVIREYLEAQYCVPPSRHRQQP